jgi:hypothetical protein
MDYLIIHRPETLMIKIYSLAMIIILLLFFNLIPYLLLGALIFCLSIIVSGFSIVYKITKDFKNEICYRFFRMIIYKSKLDLEFPEYISVFHASFVSRDEEDRTRDKFKKWTVRFFKGNTYFTILEENNYHVALRNANKLSELLGVEIYDKSKK